jgi:quercetin dioxygenase-like cupin family protein
MTAAEGQPLKAPAGAVTFKARAEETGGVLTAFESVVAPGDGPPVHLHRREDELMCVLEGRLRFELDGVQEEVRAGSSVFIPKGVPHAWQNAGSGQARLFVVFTPGAEGMERFFERSAELPDETRGPEAFKRFATDAGMEVLGPPMAQTSRGAGA